MATRERPHALSPDDARRLLGVDFGASPDEVRRAYHRAVRRWHPDLHARDPVAERTAEERTKDLNLAYQMLLAEARRGPRPPEPRPPVCPRHAADLVYRCPRCGRPACVSCLTAAGCVGCPRPVRSAGDGTSPLVWIPLMALLGFAVRFNWPVAAVLWSLWGYLALAGAAVLPRLGLKALPLLLVFPVSLPIAGGWRLFRAVFPA